MSAITLAQLVTRVQQRADMVNSTFVDFTTSGGEGETFIQQSAKALYDLVLSSWGEDYYYSSTTFSTVAGTQSYALPSDFYKLLAVDANVPGMTTPTTLQNFNWEERNLYSTSTGWTHLLAVPRYRLRAGYIWFVPVPAGVHSVTLHYVPALGTLSGSTVTFDGINGWDEWIVVDAAIKCRTKEESETGDLRASLAEMTARIKAAAPVRDIGKPPRVVDVYQRMGDL